jgi:outer membrane protein TolC
MNRAFTIFSFILWVSAQVPSAGQERALSLSLRESVLSALENNSSLRAQRYAAAAKSTAELEEKGVYDPVVSGGVSAFRTLQDPGSDFVTGGSANAGISLPLPSGTGVSAGVRAGREATSSPATSNTPFFGMDLSVTQALLRGGLDIEANLAGVRKARLDTFASRFELKGFTESLVFNVENAYWTYYLAERQAEIYRESLRLAEQHVENTRRRIQVGTLPELDLAAAQVEVAVRREALIGAEGRAETARLKLLQLAGPRDGDYWDLPVRLLDSPLEPVYRLDAVKSHVELALRSRPDLGQARLALEKGELDVVRTKNGLLPKLDLFIALGATGYADSFGAAAGNLFEERTRLSGGLSFSYPLGNSAARARSDRAAASLSQVREALRNLEALVELDIRTAYVEVTRTRAQISASAETARLQGEKLTAETEKYGVGRSTSYAVAQAQRDLLQARLGEAQAVVNHLAALLNLFKQEGTLLERRGIETSI